MRTLRITLLVAAAALLPAPALATDEQEPEYNPTVQSSEETTDDGPGWFCAEGFHRQGGLCVPDGTSGNNGNDGDGEQGDGQGD